MKLLKELTEANGAPGYEGAIRKIMKREMEQAKATIVTDHIGSVFAQKIGDENGPKVMLAGHLDEVAFMVSEITNNGYLRFVPLGGWWDQVLLSQRVHVMAKTKTYTGVIGSKPPHILRPEERNKVYPMREMFIDIGAHSDQEVEEWGVRVGDPIMPICPFEILPDGDTILAKALDNRVGCYLALSVLANLQKCDHPNVVFCGATVQEEVGLRGAATAPSIIEPEVAIAMDVGIAQDGPSDNGNKAKLGSGPLITFLDSSMIPHIGLRDFVIEVANAEQIPYQVDVLLGGGTDAGRFHLFKKGVPSLVVGVAARYIHSHVSMISKRDLEQASALLTAVVKRLNKKETSSFIDF
ncbi:endo-1,4-beta-glucanase [Fictibacillus macauensis ZFHKF-1]|uniref:Endo-1,4-beta-glucanase n=1 Tax=Fictibacillus macauensis ZFHKF-1 TaxID=1196324 RepID=I8UJW9_9BACL|nr:M42 family metallopeptidase [Fictibacillus macauensis]EIT87118.1 endo-1,4-beta-glucanase [Fictibacillus macauensis ZFHKF-1]